MEGDAGAGRLSPNDPDDSSSSEVGADQVGSVDGGADKSGTETDAEGLTETPVPAGPPSRLGRRWFIGIAAALFLLAGAVGAGGYFAAHANQEGKVIARHDADALKAAKDCVAATQAPNIAAMAASEQKIIDCATGAFRAQAVLYSSLFVEAYQAANAQVEVSDMRAAVERNNADGSIDVLVALRVKVSNSEAKNKEAGYRLRVQMAPDEGQYRIAKLDQVAK
jgi:Mce-associated membrane protein